MMRLLLASFNTSSQDFGRFQSHNDAIAAGFATSFHEFGVWFQSHNDAIAAALITTVKGIIEAVSIPQ